LPITGRCRLSDSGVVDLEAKLHKTAHSFSMTTDTNLVCYY